MPSAERARTSTNQPNSPSTISPISRIPEKHARTHRKGMARDTCTTTVERRGEPRMKACFEFTTT